MADYFIFERGLPYIELTLNNNVSTDTPLKIESTLIIDKYHYLYLYSPKIEHDIRFYYYFYDFIYKNYISHPYFDALDLSPEELGNYYVAKSKSLSEGLQQVYNFPEDCTVNPDLWKIYDLDKFVEKYGPLNAEGWDEVWQKWLESKEERAQ